MKCCKQRKNWKVTPLAQAPATPFLQLRNLNQRNEHKVQFETSYDVLDRKIDKLADMMSRLDLTKGYRQGKPSSKPL